MIAAAGGLPLTATAASRVAIRAQADPNYVASRNDSTGKTVDTYVFYPGRFFAGQVRDRTLERFPFRDIALGLAPHLAKQGFLPARSLDTADLVLVVHWGVTMGYDRAAALFSYSLDTQSRLAEARDALNQRLDELARQGALVAFDPEVNALQVNMNDLQNELESDRASAMALANRDFGSSGNANLLGINDLLHEASNAMVLTARHETLNSMLDEDRYFVVVMAYDRRSLLEDRTLRRRWSTRLSIRAPGNNFRTALSALALAGGDEFGRNIPGLTIRRPKQVETRVDIGDVVVIGETPTPSPIRNQNVDTPAGLGR